MKRLLVALAAVVFLLQACTLDQNFYIKENGGGTYEMNFDMAALMELAGDEAESLKDMEEFQDLDSEIASLMKQEGISNVKYEIEDAAVNMSFDFANWGVYEEYQRSEDNPTGEGDAVQLKLSGKKATVDLSNAIAIMKDVMDEEMEGDEAMDMSSMGEMFTLKYNFKFEKPIKKVSGGSAMKFDQSDNSVSFEIDFQGDPKDYIAKIKFK